MLFGALAQAVPDLIPAASQGTMNNLAFGDYDPSAAALRLLRDHRGGMGARHGLDGLSAVQTHMTNTLNTPVEAMEFDMPLRVREYAIRHGSGGDGAARGGDGNGRGIEFLAPARLSVISTAAPPVLTA